MNSSTFNFKRYLIALAVFTALLGGLNMAFNYRLDPLYLFSAPPKEGYFARNARERNAGIVLNRPIRAALIGTSMSENFDPDRLKNLFGMEVANLSMAGSSGYEQFVVLERLLSAQKPELIVWEVYQGAFSGDLKKFNPASTFPAFLYKDNTLGKVRYLIGIDTTLHSLKKLWGHRDQPDRINAWGHRERFSSEIALKAICNRQGGLNAQREIDHDMASLVANFKTLALSLADQNPQTRFLFFIPPVSHAFFLNRSPEAIGGYHRAKTELSKLIADRPNARLFDFEALAQIRGNLENYKDAGHYRLEINDHLAEMMALGKAPVFDAPKERTLIEQMRKRVQEACGR